MPSSILSFNGTVTEAVQEKPLFDILGVKE